MGCFWCFKGPDINELVKRVRTNAEEFDLDSYKFSMLKLHNDLRQKYKSLELKENKKLDEIASTYAEFLVNNKNANKINIYNGEILGENIIISETKSPEEVFNQLLVENEDYDFKENKFSKKTAHFTQIIWKNTTDIGCGFWADKENKKFYTVLLYYPSGNVLGKFPENIKDETIDVHKNS